MLNRKSFRDSFLYFQSKPALTSTSLLNVKLASPTWLILRSSSVSDHLLFCRIFRFKSCITGHAGFGVLDGNLVDYRSNTDCGHSDLAFNPDAPVGNPEHRIRVG